MLKLSIVVPVYNVEKYLVKCLDSLIYPERGDYELVIVDDGSTDASSAICLDYAARYPRLIRTVRTPNGGLGHARNTGIGLARGEYVLFQDSDDYLTPEAVPKMLALLDQGADIFFFNSRAVTENGRVLKDDILHRPAGAFSLESWPELLHESPVACCRVIKRGLFEETDIRFPDRLWFEDLATIPSLYLHTKKLFYIPEVWYYYLLRTGSITNAKPSAQSIQRNLEIITAMDMTLDYYKLRGSYEKYFPHLEYMAFYNQLLTATTRVNLLDRRSDVQEKLWQDFIAKFPNYRENPYIRAIPAKYKLLLHFIERRQYLALNLVMRLNNLVKGK